MMHAFIHDPELYTVRPAWIKENNVVRMNEWVEMGIASKMQECSFHISGLLLPECSTHVTQHQAAQPSRHRVSNVWWLTSLFFRDLAHSCRPAGAIHSPSYCKSKEGKGQWPQSLCGLRCASEPLVPSFTAINEKWLIWEGSFSREFRAVNLAEGYESETLVLHSDQRRHRRHRQH